MDKNDCNTATLERHPQSETLDLIAQHFPKAADFALWRISEFLKEHEIKPWQARLKPGDRCAYFWGSDDDDLQVAYCEILPFDEKAVADLTGEEELLHSPKPHLGFLIRPPFSAKANDKDNDKDNMLCSAWDIHMPLTPEQFEHLRGVGFPAPPQEFIQALLDFERTKAVASTGC